MQEYNNEGWHSTTPHLKCCKTPFKVIGKEKTIYKTILHSKCEHPNKEDDKHLCCGAITLTEKSILLRCKKCGDAKGLFAT